MEWLFLKIQDIFFDVKNGIRNIGILIALIYIIIILIFKRYILLKYAYNILNSDIFSLSGVLAGFLFTGLGLILTSNSNIINNLKATNNFIFVIKLYIRSITCYTIVILIYFSKPLLIFDVNSIIQNSICGEILLIYLLIGIYLFCFATILFIIAIFFLYQIIKES